LSNKLQQSFDLIRKRYWHSKNSKENEIILAR